jgi:anti-sigma factor RsiW
MFCDEVLELIEPIAARDVTPDGRVATHLESCPNCAAALADARQLERLLHDRPFPKAPAQFTARTMALLRRQRWRSEQFLDVGFNLALAVVALVVIGLVWVLLNRSGLVAVSNDALDLVSAGFVALARRVAPSLLLYAGATALLVTALGVWWWAERDTAL